MVDPRSTQELSPRFASALKMAAEQRVHGLDEVQQIGEEGIAEEEMW